MTRTTLLPRRSLLTLLAATLTTAMPAPFADTFPSRPIRLVVPFAAGGPADIVARDVGLKLGAELGQSVVIENQGGAAGITALSTVTRSEADGHTLLFAASGNIVLQPQLSKNGGADLVAKLRPVSLVSTSPHVLVVSGKLPVRTIKEFIDYARANPGKLSYGSAGVGGVAHLGMSYLEAVAGIDITHVPYRGTSAAIADLASGQVHALFSSYPSLQGAIDKGLVTAVGMSAPGAAGPAGKLPVIGSVVPGFEYTTWYGVYAPAAAPQPVVDRLNAAIRKVTADAALKAKLEVQGVQLVSSSPQELQERGTRDTAQWADVIKRANIKID